MVELLALLVDALAKVIPGAKSIRDKGKRAELGAQLMSFYNEANGMLVVGRELAQSLRSYVRLMEEHLQTGQRPEALAAGHQMYSNLAHQAANLLRLNNSFVRLWSSLSALVDTSSFQRLSALLSRKARAVATLKEYVDAGYLPLDVTRGLERLLGGQAGLSLESLPPNQQYWAIRDYLHSYEIVPVNVPWEANILAIVKQYLAIRHPEEQLDQIAVNLNAIRQAIVDNFDVGDILLRVRQPEA